MRKRVLIPFQMFRPVGSKIIPIHGARETYLRKIDELNLVPIFVSAVMKDSIVDELFGCADGALFMGGGDITPDFYGEGIHSETEVTEPQRDLIEIKLARRILEKRMPFLGICRGCQMLNVAAGGTLTQHIESKIPHRAQTYDDLLTREKHPITIDRKSRCYSIVKSERVIVNSAHHQSVQQLGKDLVVAARAEDGVIELIEHTDRNYFCFGVQSHPEADDGSLDALLHAFAASL